MYENSTARVKLGNGLSNVFQTEKGVLQGNNWSPYYLNYLLMICMNEFILVKTVSP
jgi:hypothetical protein